MAKLERWVDKLERWVAKLEGWVAKFRVMGGVVARPPKGSNPQIFLESHK